MQQTTKRFKATFIITSAGYILMAILMLFLPGQSKDWICYLLGAIAVVLGIIRVAFFFMKNDMSRVFQNDLAIGVVALIAGVYLIANKAIVWVWLPVILGFAVIFDSIIKLQNAFDLKQSPFKYWWILLIVSICTGVLGSLLVIGTFEGAALLVYLGVVLIIDGLANLAAVGLLSWQMRAVEKQKAEAEQASRQTLTG